jgi:GT2 family glycosyltransferase
MEDKKHTYLPISIVILSYNLLFDLKRNLDYFINNRRSIDEFELIIVDNNSIDGSQEYLNEMGDKYPEIKILLHKTNLGCGSGRNSGWEIASREIILALDHDAFIDMEAVRRIPELFSKLPEAGILAFKIVHQVTGDFQNPHGDEIKEVANHHGAGFALRRKIFMEIGGNDDEVEYGADELDFSIKLHSAGWKILYIPQIVVHHNNIIRSKKDELYRAQGYLYGNIRLLFKYFPQNMAFRNGSRYLLGSSLYWIKEFGFISLFQMISTFVNGRKEGLKNKRKIEESTIKHYNSSILRPEFGNVPIISKVFKKIYN